MKSFLAIFLTLTVFGAAVAVSKEYVGKLREASSKCAAKVEMENGLVASRLISHKLPETEEEKCVLACIMEEMRGLVDGKIDVTAFKKGNTLKWRDPAIIAKADKVVDICHATVPTEGKSKCDFALDVVLCLYKHGKAMDIPTR